jgi:hypothetical protein
MLEEKFEEKRLYKSSGEVYKTLTCKVYEPVQLLKKSVTEYNSIPIIQTSAPYERYPIIKSGNDERHVLFNQNRKEIGKDYDVTSVCENYSAKKVA